MQTGDELIVPTGIVGIRSPDDRTVRVYTRSSEGVRSTDFPLRPWLVLDEQEPADILPSGHEITILEGTQGLRRFVRCPRWPALWETVHALIRRSAERRRERIRSYLDLDRLFLLADSSDNWMFDVQAKFFSKLPMEDVVRAQIAMRTYARSGSLSRADRTDDRITAIAVSTSTGIQSSFRISKNDERALLTSFFEWVSIQDPDVIEGVRLHEHMLPYLSVRCDLLGLACLLGRDASPLRLAAPSGSPPVYEVPGRTLVDPFAFDLELDSATRAILHESALHPPRNISRRTKPSPSVESSGVAPSAECRALRTAGDSVFPILAPLCARIPVRPELIIRSTSAFRFELFACSVLLGQHRSLPSTSHALASSEPTESEYRTGCFSPAADIAVTPLLAVCAADSWTSSDSEIALQLRKDITELEKELSQLAFNPTRAAAAVLLHGGWSALTSRVSRFHDSRILQTTEVHRSSTLRAAIEVLASHNVAVIQQTGDLLTCHIPDNLDSDQAQRRLWSTISSRMPNGISVHRIGQYETAVSLGPRILAVSKAGRTVLLMKAQPPRSFEPYLRAFYIHSLDCIVKRDWTSLHRLYVTEIHRIQHHAWQVSDFVRRETVNDPIEVYAADVERGHRHPSPVYEAVLKSGRSPVVGSVIAYYVAGSRKDVLLSESSKMAEQWDPSEPDENSEYYVDRLDQCTERFRMLFAAGDFERVFTSEDLFGFDPSGIRTIVQYSGPTGTSEGISPPDRSIWLDIGTP